MLEKLYALENDRISLPVQERFRGAKTNAAMNYIVVELNRTNLSGVVLTLYDSRGNIIFDMPDIENFKPEYVNIYPNPALDYVIIELNIGNATGANLTLFDNQGKQVKNVYIPKQQQNYVLGLKDIPAGIYIVKVDYGGKNIESDKFSIIK